MAMSKRRENKGEGIIGGFFFTCSSNLQLQKVIAVVRVMEWGRENEDIQERNLLKEIAGKGGG